jgi:hypothetical protein
MPAQIAGQLPWRLPIPRVPSTNFWFGMLQPIISGRNQVESLDWSYGSSTALYLTLNLALCIAMRIRNLMLNCDSFYQAPQKFQTLAIDQNYLF